MIDIIKIYQILQKHYGNLGPPLKHNDAFQLAVAVILSAQCTDERVNLVTPNLFARFSDVNSMAGADLTEIEKLIFSTGFYRAKAKNIKNLAITLKNDFAGQLPQTMEELHKLPGIGRKTANVILNQAFDKSEGIVVDTHVMRITRLWELHQSDDAVKIEKILMQNWPPKVWKDLPLLIIYLGRQYCKARRPDCAHCVVAQLCPSAKV